MAPATWAFLGTVIKSWWDARQARASKEHELAIKEIETGIRGGDPTMRRWLGVGVFLPIAVTIVSPTWGAEIFARLKTLPDWYVELVMLVMVSVFGLSVAKEVLPSLLERIVKAWRNGNGKGA